VDFIQARFHSCCATNSIKARAEGIDFCLSSNFEHSKNDEVMLDFLTSRCVLDRLHWLLTNPHFVFQLVLFRMYLCILCSDDCGRLAVLFYFIFKFISRTGANL